MSTTLQRLLDYPHAAVFDKDPLASLAFRLNHPMGAAWTVAEGTLSASFASAEPFTYDLSAMTVSELADALRADGFTVLSESPDAAGMSALALVEGSGYQFESNGDHLNVFNSLLWSLFTGYAGEMRQARYQVGQALRQMIIPQAEGEWLDVWGGLYGVPRKGEQSDAAYAPRIPQEAFRKRVNAHGIELAVLDETGYRISIREPWKEIFRLDSSLLSGPHKFYDGSTTGYHLIRPVATSNVDWAQVLPIIARNKAAGVIVLEPEGQRMSHVDASDGHTIDVSIIRTRPDLIPYEDRALLDTSPMEEVSLPNHPARWRRELLRTSQLIVLGQPWAGHNWQADQTWATAYVAQGQHTRDYRVYYSALAYHNFWRPDVTWRGVAASWDDYGAIVRSSHTRS
jgi:hypothetical protein